MAQLDYIIQETVLGEQAKGFAISEIRAFSLEKRSSGQGITSVLILNLEMDGGRVHTLNGDAARDIYKELKKLAIVV